MLITNNMNMTNAIQLRKAICICRYAMQYANTVAEGHALDNLIHNNLLTGY